MSPLVTSDWLSAGNRPLDRKVVNQQNILFTWQADAGLNGFDHLARPVAVSKFSELGHSRRELTTYADNKTYWVLGQVAAVTNSDTGIQMLSNEYNAKALLAQRKSFGFPEDRLEYYADGTLQYKIDAKGRRITLSNYHRGIPRQVVHRDGSTEAVELTNLGKLAWYRNEVGSVFSYSYDVMGRLAQIDYPGGGSYPTVVSYQQVAWPEMGLEAGHWRQTISTGYAKTVRYFDRYMREQLRSAHDALIGAATATHRVTLYDAGGRQAFKSYAVGTLSGVLDLGQRRLPLRRRLHTTSVID